jgi:DNA (cytosine-5)-methyltransferase 1
MNGMVRFELLTDRCLVTLEGLQMSVKDEFVLVKEAAEMLGVCPNTIRAWGANGKITEYRHPVNGYRLYKRKDLEGILREMRKPQRPTK